MSLLAANLLSPNVGLIIWIAITFGLLLILLRKFAWGPITSALDERENRIQDSMDQAERALAEAKKVQADNTKARREAEADAQRLLREAREEAERLRGEEVGKTREKIQEMQENAQAEIEREKQSALADLRKEVADLAIQAAEKILSENLDDNRQRKLVDDFIDDLPRN